MIDEKKLIEEIEKYHELLKPEYISRLVDAEKNNILSIIDEQPKVNEWIPFTFDDDGLLDCALPEIDEEILISDGISVWVDTLMTDVEDENIVYYLDSSNRNLRGLAWMPLPEPHVKGASEDD